MAKSHRSTRSKVESLGRRQPRPARRRTGTRQSAIALAVRESGAPLRLVAKGV